MEGEDYRHGLAPASVRKGQKDPNLGYLGKGYVAGTLEAVLQGPALQIKASRCQETLDGYQWCG